MLFGIVGQGLGLLVVPVLQAVFRVAQEAVGGKQSGDGVFGQDAQLAEFRQRLLRAFQLQAGVLPAAYHLEDLGDEFDFANAARAELDVVFRAALLHFLLDLAV